MVSERIATSPIQHDDIYEKGQLFYEQLRYIVAADAMRKILARITLAAAEATWMRTHSARSRKKSRTRT